MGPGFPSSLVWTDLSNTFCGTTEIAPLKCLIGCCLCLLDISGFFNQPKVKIFSFYQPLVPDFLVNSSSGPRRSNHLTINFSFNDSRLIIGKSGSTPSLIKIKSLKQGHQYLALQVISKSNFDNFLWYFSILDTFTLINRISDNRI